MPLKPGMFFTVEPMINLGRPHVKVLGDGWTAVTRDRSLSAQFEHTVGVTETGVEIFTLSPKGYAPAALWRRRTATRPDAPCPETDPPPDADEAGEDHRHGHRQRLRDRFLRGGRAARAGLRDCWSCCSSAPSRGGT